ncbi:organ-specific protein S2 [Citrus clementina]|uniref:organ-specific protein S2 n=1 Tax=Citrus clementina TaxID=85681 RepID=UPI000CECE9A3|nr:organ-specific protein S2 [Citrus x clementina]
MNIKAFFVLSTVLSLLLLFANMIDARKDLGDNWSIVVKNQDIPGESTLGLVPEDQGSTISKTKAYCHTHDDSEHTMEKPFFAKNFELMPDLSIYDNGIKPTKQKAFAKNFELMPDLSIYDNGIKPTKQKFFAKNFELMPDVSIYDNDIKPTKRSSYAKDFELKADISIHEPTEQKSVVSSTDLQPDATIYHN